MNPKITHVIRSLIIPIVALTICATACQKHTFEDDLRGAESILGVGEVRSAIKRYKAMVKRYGKNERVPEILLRIAKIYEELLYDDEKAVEFYNKLISQSPLSKPAAIARQRRAFVAERNGDYDAAIEDYSMLAKHFKGYPEYYDFKTLLAGAYLASGKYSQARIELIPVIDGEDVSQDMLARALFIYAEAFFLGGKSRNAIRWYNVLISSFPKSEYSDEARLHAATCYEELGRLGAARALTESAKKYPNQAVIDVRLNSIDMRGTQILQSMEISEPIETEIQDNKASE